MKNYMEFKITLNPFISDIASGMLWNLEPIGINENEDSLSVFFYEDSGINAEQISVLLDELKTENLLETYEITGISLQEKNWNAEWESNINVIEVSDKFVIKPSFKEYTAKEGQIILHIDPKMSFGTGDHESTRLMLRLMESINMHNSKTLDIGSGTGVLAIAAVKLGAESAVAVDNNEWCYDNAVENAERNIVSDKLKIVEGEIDDISGNDFDIILANINRNVLLEIKDKIYSKLKPGGKILLSGILITDGDMIKQTYTGIGLQFTGEISEGEWTAFAFTKRN